MKKPSHKIRLTIKILCLAWRMRPAAVTGFLIGAILETTATVMSLYATAQLGNLLAELVRSGEVAGIWRWLWVDVAAGVVIGLSFWLMSHCKRLLYFRITQWSTAQFFSTLCRIDLPDFYDNEIRNQINKAQNGYSWQLPNLAESSLDLLYALLRFLAVAGIVAQITWWLIPLVALFLIPSLLSESKLAKVQWFVWDEKGDERHVFWGLDWIVRRASGQFELRSSQARQYILDKIDTMNRTFYRRQEQKYLNASRRAVPAKILESVGVTIGAVMLLRQFLNHTLSLDHYFFLSGGLLRIGSELNNIFGTLTRMQEPLLFAENYFALTDRRPMHVDKPDAIKLPARRAPRIQFENLSFTYPGQDSAVFRKLNLVIEPGEHVALVGENGAGKSTLIKLLMRFYKPDSGRILLDGIDLEDIAIESWYNHLATLFQDFNQYPFSVQENIEVARSIMETPQSRLRSAADFSGVTGMVKSYEYGWETVLDSSFKKGIEPSGGQWQRVALARAFYRQADVLILDEPTAAIDAKAEYDIFNKIFDHYQNKTALIISHRFGTVRRADRIVVVDKGKIVEQGSHDELMKHKNLYYEMFSKQAEGYR